MRTKSGALDYRPGRLTGLELSKLQPEGAPIHRDAPLRRRMIEDMQLCLAGDTALLRARGRQMHPPSTAPPDRLRLEEIQAYQSTHHDRQFVAGFRTSQCAPSVSFTASPSAARRIPYARKHRQLPVILSADEMTRFFAAVPSLKAPHGQTAYPRRAPGCRKWLRLKLGRYR